MKSDFDTIVERIGFGFFVLVLMSIATLSLFCAFNSVLADGKVSFCYIMQTHRGYSLMGHREWRPDVEMGNWNRIEDALATASLTDCPLNIRNLSNKDLSKAK